jgi:hypothetical protein
VWEPQPLAILRASTACTRVALPLHYSFIESHQCKTQFHSCSSHYWLLVPDIQVQSQENPYEICGGRSGISAGLSPSNPDLCQFLSTYVPCSSAVRGWCDGAIWSPSSKGLSHPCNYCYQLLLQFSFPISLWSEVLCSAPASIAFVQWHCSTSNLLQLSHPAAWETADTKGWFVSGPMRITLHPYPNIVLLQWEMAELYGLCINTKGREGGRGYVTCLCASSWRFCLL